RGRAGRRARLYLPDREEPGPVDPAVHWKRRTAMSSGVSSVSRVSRRSGFRHAWLLLALAASPASAETVRVYVTNSAGDSVHVIDTASLELAKSIPVNGRLHNVYVTPDNRFVVTGSIRTRMLTVIDLKTEQTAWELKMSEGVRPMTFETAPDGSVRRIFVQLSLLNGFAVVDFAARKETAQVVLPAEPAGFGIQERRGDSPSPGL